MTRGRILLVDDEDMVRALARTLLERDGHTVLEASSGADALARYADHPDGIDLLLTDVIMPGLSGPQLYEQLRARCPNLRVVFMSGFADGALDNLGLRPGRDLLVKPFSLAKFTAHIREALERPGFEQKEEG